MRIKCFGLILFFVLLSSIAAIGATKGNSIYVKFKSGSFAASEWLRASRMGECPSLVPALGRHSSRPMISDGLVSMMLKGSNSLNLANDNKARSLINIAIITYEENIPAHKAARAAESIDGVEYAEPVPQNEYFSEPNDPDYPYQWYLPSINAEAAWAAVPDPVEIVVGVVDTGVDYLHEDLASNIFINPGETGTDSHGNDKRTNGIDDDNNGFVDDWHGWDFLGESGTAEDNDPMPGNLHGTHVAGTIGAVTDNAIGVAGVARKVKLIPVKCGYDNANSRSIDRGYEGILYASLMGAKVINCSWGSDSYSVSEQTVISTANARGSLVVCAAGNDNVRKNYYPASYQYAMSVAALDYNDTKADFSNYGSGVSVSAPGVQIYATLPSNGYGYLNGTSMASPIVAGTAALVRQKYPKLSPEQVMELIKATCDNIDFNNPNYVGALGSGKINAYRAVSDENIKAVSISGTKVYCAGDAPIETGRAVSVDFAVHCLLAPFESLKATLVNSSSHSVSIRKGELNGGSFANDEEKTFTGAFEFTIVDNVYDNYPYEMAIRIEDGKGYSKDFPFSFTANPSYLTMRENDISLTVSSQGNYAYNDYPNNQQGDGLFYRKKGNLLFEGAFMAAHSYHNISNTARSATDQYTKDLDFFSQKRIAMYDSSAIGAKVALVSYMDSRAQMQAGVNISQKVYQFTKPGHENYIISVYDITNQFGADVDSMYAGIFFDWDIGLSGRNNIVQYDKANYMAYAHNALADTLPFTAVAPLTNDPLNLYAINNDGSSGGFGIYDGFSDVEKWKALSSGLARTESAQGDVSMVISNGPIPMKDTETKRVAFVLLAGQNLEELRRGLDSARANALAIGIVNEKFDPAPKVSRLVSISPNPAIGSDIVATMDLRIKGNVSFEAFNALGQRVLDLQIPSEYGTDRKLSIPTGSLPIGFYFLKIRADGIDETHTFVVNR